MKKKVLLIPLVLLLAVSLIACAAPAPSPAPAPAPEKPTYSWRMAQSHPDPKTSKFRAAEMMCERSKELSGGRINITHYPGDLLGDYMYTTEQVAKGTIELNLSVIPTVMDPRLNAASISYVVFDFDAAKAAFGSGGWAIEMFNDIAESVNWKIVGIFPEAFNQIISRYEFRPVPQEIKPKAIKLRTMAMETEKLMGESLGFSPIVIPWSELFMALQTGVVDGASGMILREDILRMFDDALQPDAYMYKFDYFFSTYWLVMNLDLWNSLSLEDQQIMSQVGNEAVDWVWGQLEEEEAACRVAIDELGWTLVELTPEEKAICVKAVREAQWPYMEKMVGKALMDKIRENAQVPPGG